MSIYRNQSKLRMPLAEVRDGQGKAQIMRTGPFPSEFLDQTSVIPPKRTQTVRRHARVRNADHRREMAPLRAHRTNILKKDAPQAEDGFGVSLAKGFQPNQSLGQFKRDVRKVEPKVRRFAGSHVRCLEFLAIRRQEFAKMIDLSVLDGKTARRRMAPITFQYLVARDKGVANVDPNRRTRTAMPARKDTNGDCLAKTLHHARGNNARDARMSVRQINDLRRRIRNDFRKRFVRHPLLNGLAFGIVEIDPNRVLAHALAVRLQHKVQGVHAAGKTPGRIDARPQHKAEVARRQLAARVPRGTTS